MSGYIRQDTSNKIANGVVIDADDLDREFDALATAFNLSAGHAHDGTPSEGAPITVIGPVQDVEVTFTGVVPKTTNTYDLGSDSNRWKNLYVEGVAEVGSLILGEATLDGAAITTASNAQTLTNKTFNLGNNTLVATSAQLAAALTDETGTGSLVFSVSPALTGVPTAPTAAVGTDTTQVATTAHVFAERTNAATLTNKTLTSPTINGGTVSGITDLTIADGGTGASTAPQALINLGLTATAAEINKLDGFTGTTSGLNTAVSNFIPSGGIILWFGSVATIPSGWALCNGDSSTPDLRGRMVIGAGGAYGPGVTGGASTVTLSSANLPAHTHTFSGTTNTTGSHTHTFQMNIDETGGDLNPTVGKTNTGVGTTNAAGDHSHTFSGTTSSVGSGTAVNILNPYYALAYIMKL